MEFPVTGMNAYDYEMRPGGVYFTTSTGIVLIDVFIIDIYHDTIPDSYKFLSEESWFMVARLTRYAGFSHNLFVH